MNCCSVYTNQLALLHHVLVYSKHLEKNSTNNTMSILMIPLLFMLKKRSGPSLKETLFDAIILCDEIKIC